MQRYLEQWKSGFGHHTYEAREIADAGGGRCAIRLGLAATIGETEIEVEEEYAGVLTIEAGLVVRQENFYEWRDALAVLTEAPPAPRGVQRGSLSR